jgi:hypothetical protein
MSRACHDDLRLADAMPAPMHRHYTYSALIVEKRWAGLCTTCGRVATAAGGVLCLTYALKAVQHSSIDRGRHLCVVYDTPSHALTRQGLCYNYAMPHLTHLWRAQFLDASMASRILSVPPATSLSKPASKAGHLLVPRTQCHSSGSSCQVHCTKARQQAL